MHPLADLNEFEAVQAHPIRDTHPEEIADAIADNRRSAEELLTLYPFVELAARRE